MTDQQKEQIAEAIMLIETAWMDIEPMPAEMAARDILKSLLAQQETPSPERTPCACRKALEDWKRIIDFAEQRGIRIDLWPALLWERAALSTVAALASPCKGNIERGSPVPCPSGNHSARITVSGEIVVHLGADGRICPSSGTDYSPGI